MPTTTTGTISGLATLLGFVLVIGSIRGAILLIKDAIKYKKFAKRIRIACASIVFLTLIGAIAIVIIVFSSATGTSPGLTTIINITGVITIVSVITNIRGGILLFMQSMKLKGFSKRIRIICGVLMIITLLSPYITRM